MPFLTGWPTDAGDGSVSTEARWRKMAQLWAPSGVVDGYLDRLDPDYAVGTVTVGAGAAWIDGHYAEQLTSSSVSVTSNGLVVIRWTPAANTFELLYRNGATTPTQTDPTWELPIAQMSGGSMTDLREFVTRGTITTRMIDDEAVTSAKLAGDVGRPRSSKTGGNVTNADTTLTAGSSRCLQPRSPNRPPGTPTRSRCGASADVNGAGGAVTVSVRASPPGPTTAPNANVVAGAAARHEGCRHPRPVHRHHRRRPGLLGRRQTGHRQHRRRRIGHRVLAGDKDHVDVELGTVAAWITGIGAVLSAGAGVAMIWREVKSASTRRSSGWTRSVQQTTQDQVVATAHVRRYSVEVDPRRPRHRRR